MSVIRRGILTRRVRDVIATRQHPSHHHITSTSPLTSSQCLLHPSHPHIHSQRRHLTVLTPIPSLSSPVNLSLHPSVSLHPSLPFLRTSLHPSASFSSSPSLHKARPKVDGGPTQEKKQRQDKSVLITVIDTEDKVSVISLDKAERLARRRDLKMVKIDDPTMVKGSKEVYKLMTGKQYFEEEIKAKKNEKKLSVGAKDEKILVIGGKITPHDLGFKIHSLEKWLKRGHQVKVTITSRKATKEDVESVFSTIEEEVKKVKARILQRQEKMNDLKFYIAPLKEKEEKEEKEKVSSSETTNPDDLVQSEQSSDHTKP